MKSTLLFGWLMLCLFVNASAQIVETKNLSLDGAKKVAELAVKYAVDHNAPGGSIAIVDAGGHLLYLVRLDGTFPASAEVAYGKAKTAATFRFESKKLEDAINSGRTSLVTVGPLMLQGGVPIIYDGQVVGAIGVSGAKSADQDREIAMAGATAKLN